MKTPWEIEIMPRKDKWEVKMSASAGGGNYILPVASSQILGGVKPVDKTEDMNLPVGVDTEGRLWVSGEVNLEIATDEEIIDLLVEEDMLVAVSDLDGNILADENENVLLW